MHKLFLLLFFTWLTLEARNPYPFAALGDVIYNNASKIEYLKSIADCKEYSKKIDNYLAKVKAVKKEGFELEAKKHQNKKEYLQKLRSLAKEYDFFRYCVDKRYGEAIENNNVMLVSQLINSGLLNTEQYKQEILDFYFAHVSEMPTEGLIQSYLNEDAKLRKKREAQRKRYLSKKQKEQERIKRIRQEDLKEQQRLEQKLQRELLKKKKEIREYQKKELSKTI
jgi:hypothetical protein